MRKKKLFLCLLLTASLQQSALLHEQPSLAAWSRSDSKKTEKANEALRLGKPPLPLPVAAIDAKKKSADELLSAGSARVDTESQVIKSAIDEFGRVMWETAMANRMRLTGKVPVTGQGLPGMERFEKEFLELMAKWLVPGGTVAIAYKGKLVYARGFGYADLNTRTVMEPDTLFRIASISKAVTAVAALRLCDQGKLKLDSRPFAVFSLTPKTCKNPDPHLNDITLQQLLQCTAGWDRTRAGDPMFVPIIRDAAHDNSPSLRPTAASVRKYWLCRNLDFIPGTHFSYSNFSYSLLGRIIELASGQDYAAYVKDNLLKPLGITRMQPGKTLELARGETTYYPFPGQERNKSIYPNVKGLVPLPYGSDFCLEAMLADAGWLASAVDLVRFATSTCGEGPGPRPIKAETLTMMTTKADVPEWHDKKFYFAMGWEADLTKGDKEMEISRQGSLAGVMTYLNHSASGVTFAYCINTRPFMARDFHKECLAVMKKAIASRKTWPTVDQFSQYP